MAIVGYVSLVIVAVAVLGLVVMALMSVPDIRRYLRIRAM